MGKVNKMNIGKSTNNEHITPQEDYLPSSAELLPILAIESEIVNRIGRTFKIRDLLEDLLAAHNQTISYQAWLLTDLFLKCKMIRECAVHE